MPSKAEQLVDRELAARLEKVAFHFVQRDALRTGLSGHKTCESSGDPMANKQIRELATRIHNEEVSLLYELVHLMDNTEKYFGVYRLRKSELEVIRRFKPFRVASNFVNTHKHGTRGRNRPSAKHDYTAFIHAQGGHQPGPQDAICDVRSLINYEGQLFDSVELIESLIRVWEMFLRYHTTVDVQAFVSTVGEVFSRRKGQSLYSARIPKGVLGHAKRNADARKQLKLS